jgi:hypothetical protein
VAAWCELEHIEIKQKRCRAGNPDRAIVSVLDRHLGHNWADAGSSCLVSNGSLDENDTQFAVEAPSSPLSIRSDARFEAEVTTLSFSHKPNIMKW